MQKEGPTAAQRESQRIFHASAFLLVLCIPCEIPGGSFYLFRNLSTPSSVVSIPFSRHSGLRSVKQTLLVEDSRLVICSPYVDTFEHPLRLRRV